MDNTETFATKEIPLAVYLRFRGHYCIGTIPANNPYKPNERLWIFQPTDELITDVATFKADNPLVPVKDAFYYAKVLKNLLNDKDEF